MSLASDPRSTFWSEHFQELANAETGNEQLDFSNQALVVQNYAFVLEACGEIAGKRVLDAGFGTGELTRMLDLMGGDVSAFDMVATRIARLREEAPTIAWWHDDITSWKPARHSDPFDLVVACETLQYVEFNSAVRRFLKILSPQGRIVILIPNADCPIVQRVSRQFDNQYLGVSMQSLDERLRGLVGEYDVYFRGIHFQQDQTVAPYRSGAWQKIPSQGSRLPMPHFRESLGIPNRLQIVISRCSINDTAKDPADDRATPPAR